MTLIAQDFSRVATRFPPAFVTYLVGHRDTRAPTHLDALVLAGLITVAIASEAPKIPRRAITSWLRRILSALSLERIEWTTQRARGHVCGLCPKAL